MTIAMFITSHGLAHFEGDNHNRHGRSTVNCDQELMEKIFVCLSQYNVSVTDFLLAVGGINGSSNNYPKENDWKTETSQNINSTGATTLELFNNRNNNLQVNDTEADTDIAVTNESVTVDNGRVEGDSFKVDHGTKGVINGSGSAGKSDSSRPESDDGMDELKADIKEDVCRHQQQVMECTFHAAKSLIENPVCAPSGASQSVSSDLLVNDQRYRIKSLMEAILGQYDNFCAHDCRNELIVDMRSCYEEFDLDPKLFLSQESHGAVIGSSAYEAEVFCQNREALVKCLLEKSAHCPEADLVLSAIGLDLELMERGFSILCQNQYTYLRSLQCFESHTPEVGICHSLKHRRIINIASLATLQHWSNKKYLHEACRVRLEHIRCDLDAWANKEDGTCDEHILDLKRRLHCSLIPSPCLDDHQSRTDTICKTNHSSNGTQNKMDSRRILMIVVVAVVFVQLIQYH